MSNPASLMHVNLDEYRRNGVLFPLRVLAENEVNRFLSCFHDVLAMLGEQARPASLAQCQLHFRWAYELATHPAVLDVVEGVIGSDILVHSLSIFWKRPNDRSFVSWHQDGHYMRLSEPAFVSAWVALTDSQPANGCMRVVPGSHLRGRLLHGETALKEENLLSSGLEIAVEVNEDEAQDVVLRPGEMSLHDVDIIHGSNPNTSDLWRVGFAIRYVAPHVKQVALHHPVLLARGRDRYHNYEVASPPDEMPYSEALAKQAAFAEWLTRLRQSQGRHG